MSEKASQFRIGVFVAVGVAIVIAGLFLFGIRGAFQPTYMFETYTTSDVDGLSIGSAVKLRGVTVGKVTEIGFSWNLYGVLQPPCVVVRCSVRQRLAPEQWRGDFGESLQGAVDRGLRAVVRMEGITGTSIVSLQTLDPANNPPLKVPWTPKYPSIPSAPSQLGQILASVDRTLTNLERLDVKRLSDTLNRTLDTADAVLKNLNQLDMRALSHNANQAIENGASAIQEIRGLAQDARAGIKSLELGEVGTDATRLLTNLDARLAVLIDRLAAIDVRSLNDTLAGTRDAARSLNEAIEQLKRFPSGFFFGPPPPMVPVLEKEK